MNEHTEFPPDGTPAGSTEMPVAAPGEPHPADAHALEFDATATAASPALGAKVLPFPTRAGNGESTDESGPQQPWSDAVMQARLRLLELESEQVEPLRAAVLSHGRAVEGGLADADASVPSAPGPRLARRVLDLLDEAEIAADECEWAQASEWLLDALVLDPENDEALALLAMVTRRLTVAAIPSAPASEASATQAPSAPLDPETPAEATSPVTAAEAPSAPIAEPPAEPEAQATASLDVAVIRWESRGFRVRERSAARATLRERRHASLRGFLASLLLGVGLGGVVYLIYALLLQSRREIRLRIEGDRIAVSGELRVRNPVVVALDVVAVVAVIAALGLLAIGGAQIAGLL
jgi:hypothetical protein